MPSPDPILYSFRRCPYAMRARIGVLEAGFRTEIREVKLSNKPLALLEASSKGTVPVLVLEDRVLHESLDILLHVLPEDHPWRASELEDLELIARNDGPFKHHLDRAKYGTRYPDEDPLEHREAATQILRVWDERLSKGSLSEHGFGLADVCIGPFVRQLANHDRSWFSDLEMPRLKAWLEAFLEHPRFTGVMGKLPPWEPGQAPVYFGT